MTQSSAGHRRAARAWAEGRFARSVVPVKDFVGLTLLDRDETVRPETSVETLAALSYAFLLRGTWPESTTLLGIGLLVAGVMWAVRIKPQAVGAEAPAS